MSLNNKKAVLLHVSGEAVKDIYYTVEDAND
jgi:hypothetical protein